MILCHTHAHIHNYTYTCIQSYTCTLTQIYLSTYVVAGITDIYISSGDCCFSRDYIVLSSNSEQGLLRYVQPFVSNTNLPYFLLLYCDPIQTTQEDRETRLTALIHISTMYSQPYEHNHYIFGKIIYRILYEVKLFSMLVALCYYYMPCYPIFYLFLLFFYFCILITQALARLVSNLTMTTKTIMVLL